MRVTAVYRITAALLPRATAALAILGGALLLGGAAMILCSVAGRVLFSAPVPGDFELMEILAAMAVFSFLPQLMLEKGNVTVTVITRALPEKYKRLLDRTSLLLFAAAFAALAYYGALGAYEALIYETQTQIWGFPIFFPMAYGSLCLALSALVSLLLLLSLNESSDEPAQREEH